MSTPRGEQRSWLRVLLVIIAVVVLAPLLMMVFMMPMMGMMWSGGGAPGTGMSPAWGIGMMLVFLLVLLGIGYLLYRTFTQASPSADDPALEELRLAYARGELSREEFEQRREDLQRTE